MNAPPLIAISSNFFHAEDRRFYKHKELEYADANMASAVEDAGGFPVMVFRAGVVDAEALEARARDTISRVRGLVLTGGTDVSPTSYGEEPLDPAWAGDAIRDAWEIALYHEALRQGRPILGICRGCQLINVAEGGTLWQDLVTIKGSEVHRSQELYDKLQHGIILAPDSELEELFGDAPRIVNSIHHQAARRIGEALVEVARSPDEVTEAVVRTKAGPWVLGVQFHPEWMLGSEIRVTIFKRFLEKVLENEGA